jgi:hypothetical protein
MPDRDIQEFLESKSAELLKKAEKLPEGKARNEALDRVSMIDEATRIADRWALSSGLRPPK